MVAGAGSGSAAAAGQAAFNPSDEAIADIPAPLITLYIEAAARCPGLPWQVLAGIGKVESNHGRYGGATVRADGQVEPPIIGIPLDGTNGTARIPDTDNGAYDGDTVWDRAVGPMQFIPSSWRIFGVDGNGDGVRDPHNIIDAVHAAVRHLCPAGTVTDIEAALFSYNRSSTYVATVLDWAARYAGPLAAIGDVTEGYAYPLPAAYATEAIATRSHHDYPAFDAGTPVGTPVFAMVGGTITTAIGNAGIYQPGGRRSLRQHRHPHRRRRRHLHLLPPPRRHRHPRPDRRRRPRPRAHRRPTRHPGRRQHHRPPPPPRHPRLRQRRLPPTNPARHPPRHTDPATRSPHQRLLPPRPLHRLGDLARLTRPPDHDDQRRRLTMATAQVLLDITQLAERLGVSERFVRRLVEERRIPFLKIGKYVRFDPDDVDRWIAHQRISQTASGS